MLTDLTDDLAARLAADLPDAARREVAERYLDEPRGNRHGRAGAVFAPGTTEEVATILRFAHENRIAVVPYGGGTGLVGGQLTDEGTVPLVLSLERMSKIRAVHPGENVLVAEAGAILADVQEAAAEADRLFPLSLASEGSARLGGLMATNAGGVNVLRYGNARDLTLGIEAVLPDGTIVNALRRLRKDNTGYDLRHLMVGAEGTLGIITAVSLRLFQRPAKQGVAMLVVDSPAAAQELLQRAQHATGGGVSAFELISGQGLRFQVEAGLDVRQPFAEIPEWCVLVDLGLPEAMDPETVLEDLFAAALEDELVSDGVIAQSAAQADALWQVRESIPEGNKRVGAIASHDISLPLGAIPDFLETAATRLQEAQGPIRINAFGHLGDGNLHFNQFPPEGETKADHAHKRDAISRIVHDLVHEMEGSFSAEHGVGRLKVDELERYGDPGKLIAMRTLKDALDPHGIMNPGAVLRAR
ncbi:FAD/FMN-containing dehydrogenase [Tranquillimonas rosea]|uniref:FAD/FMN-containing dehydrogenase n=1 Tax=Tranquillimonas rosea TaxID=641238 RepID=A0A1H9UX14_9RHOB|nr:FAD-binding oxidoreductase [Tranquillimonas rosea]SES14015.1 FAD/FMN-containing dehydrogenase [Tranquillimonas rosea]